jgi:hypothetical protein
MQQVIAHEEKTREAVERKIKKEIKSIIAREKAVK